MTETSGEMITCGVCGADMEAGYVWLAAGQACALQWDKERPDLSALKFWEMEKGESLLRSSAISFPKSVREAHRCPSCQTVTIERVDKKLDSPS